MAEFLKAFDLTNKNEGGYSFNKDDHGGETYAGIARNYWPNWAGWKYIDQIKESHKTAIDIDDAIKVSATPIHLLVENFYQLNFWKPLCLDLVNDQQLANAVYDFGVNSGIGQSAKLLQRACNANGSVLFVDGEIGAKTIIEVNRIEPQLLYESFNRLRQWFYNSLAARPGQHQFLASWLSRIKPYQVA